MTIENKLQELKEMHEKALITSAVYEEHQKALLTNQLSNDTTNANKSAASTVPASTNKSISTLLNLFIIFLSILGCIWFFYKVSGTEGKRAISQVVAETGVGKQVIPWPDRAEAVANSIITANQQNIANSIQKITHPTGKNPTLASYTISKLNDSIIVEFQVSWLGGLTENNYTTVINWEINDNNHVAAKVTQDSALVDVESKNANLLDNYFLTKVYPAFVQDMGG